MSIGAAVRGFFQGIRDKRAPVPPPAQNGFIPTNGCFLIPRELQLIELIAEHGMGSVWKARNFKKNLDVVVKFPLDKGVKATALFTSEADLAKVLKHPNIVEVYGIINHQDTLCMEEEFLRGQDFDTWRTEQTAYCFPWHLVRDYAGQVGRALAYAHTQKIYHRDVKPGNIMRVDMASGTSIAKLIDFGIASRKHVAGKRSAMSTGAHSLRYASPQQIAGHEGDAYDDVYGFCATLYELLTGCTVFEGIPGDPVHNIQYTQAPEPNERLKASAVGFRIPPPVVRALLLGLRKDCGGDKGRTDDIMRIVRLMETAPEPTQPVAPIGRWESGAKDSVRLASSGLIVIECLRESLDLNTYFENAGFSVACRPHTWDASILQKIQDGWLDGAVLNARCVETFKSTNPNCDIEIVCPCRRSMNGDCFYLMGRADIYSSALKEADLRAALERNTIFVNDLHEHRQALEVFLAKLLGPKHPESVQVAVVPLEDTLQTLKANPKALIYCGQNFRLIAGQRHEFVEVTSLENCPREWHGDLQAFTDNVFVVNRKFGEAVQLDKLRKHCQAAQHSFAKNCKKPKVRDPVVERISKEIRDHEFREEEIQEAIKTAIIRTFTV